MRPGYVRCRSVTDVVPQHRTEENISIFLRNRMQGRQTLFFPSLGLQPHRPQVVYESYEFILNATASHKHTKTIQKLSNTLILLTQINPQTMNQPSTSSTVEKDHLALWWPLWPKAPRNICILCQTCVFTQILSSFFILSQWILSGFLQHLLHMGRDNCTSSRRISSSSSSAVAALPRRSVHRGESGGTRAVAVSKGPKPRALLFAGETPKARKTW